MAQQLKVGRDVLVPVPGHLPDRQPGPGGGAVLRRPADHRRHADVGEWQKFSLYLAYVFFPMGQLGFIINLMSQAQRLGQRIFEILDTTERDRRTSRAPSSWPASAAAVEFDNVTFRYFGGGDAGAERRHLRRRARPDGRAAGRHRQRQDHHHQPAPALLRRRPRAAC